MGSRPRKAEERVLQPDDRRVVQDVEAERVIGKPRQQRPAAGRPEARAKRQGEHRAARSGERIARATRFVEKHEGVDWPSWRASAASPIQSASDTAAAAIQIAQFLAADSVGAEHSGRRPNGSDAQSRAIIGGVKSRGRQSWKATGPSLNQRHGVKRSASGAYATA